MPLLIIGAGFGRTGTDSLREALNILGYGPTHHMFELNENPQMRDLWREKVNAGVPHDWDTLFRDYRSCVDWPGAAYWPELAAAFPEAKVILTTRNAESWWESFSNTILPFASRPEEAHTVGGGILRQVFGEAPVTRENALRLFKKNAARAEAELPRDRLLVLPVGAGWTPLCDFLGAPEPDTPWPNRNSTSDIKSRIASDVQK